MADEIKPTGPVLHAAPAIATATVHITRAKTGAVETYELVFTPLPDQPAPEPNTEGAC